MMPTRSRSLAPKDRAGTAARVPASPVATLPRNLRRESIHIECSKAALGGAMSQQSPLAGRLGYSNFDVRGRILKKDRSRKSGSEGRSPPLNADGNRNSDGYHGSDRDDNRDHSRLLSARKGFPRPAANRPGLIPGRLCRPWNRLLSVRNPHNLVPNGRQISYSNSLCAVSALNGFELAMPEIPSPKKMVSALLPRDYRKIGE